MARYPVEDRTIRQALAMAHLGIWRIDTPTGELAWSEGMYHLYDVDAGTEPTLPAVLERVHPDDLARVRESMDRMARGERVARLEHRLLARDGSVRHVESTGGLDADGGMVGVVQDATDRWLSRQRLEAARVRGELAEAIAQLGSWMLDGETGELSWSPQLFSLLGLDPATFVPTLTSVLDFTDATVKPQAERFVANLLQGGASASTELRVRRADGVHRWFEVRGRLIGSGGGGVGVGVIQDVTDRRLAEEQLRMQAQILEAMTDCVVVIRPGDDRVVWSNPQAAGELGLSVDTLVGRSASEFTAPGQDALLADMYRQLADTGRWTGEITRRRADGTTFQTEARLSSMDHPEHGEVWLGVSHDIDDRKAREKALHESEMRLRAVQDNAPTGIATIDLTGRWKYVNDALCTILDRSRSELEAMTIQDLGHPEEEESAIALALDLIEGRAARTQSERRYLRRDGTTVWVLMTVTLVRDPQGEPQFFVAHLVDITDRKAEDEVRRRQAVELQRASRAKTDFLSRMSHELRTPLNAVIGFGQLLAEADLTVQDHGSVEQILYAGRHLLGLIDEVLDVTRVESGTLDLQIEPVELADVIGEAVDLVRTLAGDAGVTLGVDDRGGRDRFVLGDRRRVVQVLLNLLSNAIKYNHPGGDVTVRTAPAPDGVRIAVADDGRGIPPEALPRLFEPFDRLGVEREGIEGTGIGLALARALVEEMGGTIGVESTPGRGSTFTVDLPTTRVPATVDVRTPAAPRSPLAPDGHHALTVVNIEDNPANQQLITSILHKRTGVELWTAPDATSGLDLVRRHRPGLVLLDLHLPDLPGDEVLRQLRAEPPAILPVVAVCSADANPAQIEALTRMGADHYITKPLDIRAFLAIVDDAAARQQTAKPADAR